MSADDILDLGHLSDDGDDGRIPVSLISPLNFLILSLLTFGLYVIWWMYTTWRFYKNRDALDIWPAVRAIFGVLFFYNLAEMIKGDAQSHKWQGNYPSIMLAILYFLLNLTSRLPDPYLWISSLAPLVFLQPVTAFNHYISSSPDFDALLPKGLRTGELVIVVIGLIWWGLVYIGSTVPEY